MAYRLSSGFLPLVVAGVLLSALSAWIATRIALAQHIWEHEEHHEVESDSPAGSGAAGDFHAWMHSQLALTAEQKAELAPFEVAYEAQRNRVTKDIHAAGKDLADAVRRGQRDSSAIAEALDRMNAARMELQKLTLDHFFVMKEHLDPDQAQSLLQWTHDSLLR
ncbi:MAG TPA: periplasmic heavy metal sensor [Verrucomicrobiales bacterium]|nr:periplasmic heavy metal sensor [Verrucomicrobiales bacterium]